MALAPPDRPVPAPRVTTGTPSSAQTATACATSTRVVARYAATADPTRAHTAWSWSRLATTSRSVTSRLAGRRRVSSSSTLVPTVLSMTGLPTARR